MFLVDVDNHPREEQLGPCQDQQLEQGPEQQRDQGADEAGQQAEQMGRPDVGAEQAIKQGIGLEITVGRVKEKMESFSITSSSTSVEELKRLRSSSSAIRGLTGWPGYSQSWLVSRATLPYCRG